MSSIIGNYSPKLCAKKAWEAMSKAGIAHTPENYTLWYAHFAGVKPALTHALEEIIREHGEISEADCEMLYDKFFAAELVRHNFRLQTEALLHKMDLLQQRLTRPVNSADAHDTAKWDSDTANILPQAIQALQLERIEMENWLDEAIAVIKGLRRETGTSLSPVHMDALTGLADQSSFLAELQIRVEIAVERSEPLSLALVKISNTDTLPDDASVMQELAETLNGSIKGRDFLARSDDWELAMVLPRTRLSQADRLCQNIREDLALKQSDPRIGWIWSELQIGIGVAQLHFPETPSKLMERARHCVETALQKKQMAIICEDSPPREKTMSTDEGEEDATISLFPVTQRH